MGKRKDREAVVKSDQPTLFDLRKDLSPAQRTMGNDAVDREPYSIGNVTDALLGVELEFNDDPLLTQQIRAMAHDMLAQHAPTLVVDLKQWRMIQNAVEAGIYAGWLRGRPVRG